VYVASEIEIGGFISVISTSTNTVTATVRLKNEPGDVAVSPNGAHLYVADHGSSTVFVIDTATNAVTATVQVGDGPWGVAVSPDGARLYVASYDTVSVIDTATNIVLATVAVGGSAVAVSRDGSRVSVVNRK
jgi:YVTN family beta-propeller protein